MAKKKTAPQPAAASGPAGGSSGVNFLTGSVALGPRLFNFGARIINTGEFIMPASAFNQKLIQETGRRQPVLQPFPINHDMEAISARNEEGLRAASEISGGPVVERNTRWRY